MNENTPGTTLEAVYLPLKEASKRIGLPVYYLRRGVQGKRFPFEMVGNKYYLNVPGTLRVLEQDRTTEEGAEVNDT